MPKILESLPETQQSITRPAVLEVTRELFNLTGIDKNVPILYPDDEDRMLQPGTSISHEGRGINRFPYEQRVTIVVDEDYQMDRLNSTAVIRDENFYVFRDDAIETYIKPVYGPCETTISFVYQGADRNEVLRWRDDMRNRISMFRSIQHDYTITYHYLYPEVFLYILKEIHRLRENIAGYDETYEEYFRKKATEYATTVVTQAGTGERWAIAETQARVIGWFDFDTVPERATKSEGGDSWTINFNYKFQYDKPLACVMSYPIVIHNQLLSTEYRPNKPPYELEQFRRAYPMSAKYLYDFESATTHLRTTPGIPIPSFDEFIPSQVVYSTMRLMTGLVLLDKENPNTLMSLKDLGRDYKLQPDIEAFMAIEAPYMTQIYQSIFVMSLYRKNDLVAPTPLVIDSNLNITSTFTLEFREYYHIRIGIVKDLSLLSPAALKRLQHNGEALRILLNTIDPTLKEKGLLPTFLGEKTNSTVAGQKFVTMASLQAAIKWINRAKLARGNHQEYFIPFGTVENMTVISKRL